MINKNSKTTQLFSDTIPETIILTRKAEDKKKNIFCFPICVSSTNYVHPIKLLPVFVIPWALSDKNKLLSKNAWPAERTLWLCVPWERAIQYRAKQIILQQIRIEFQFARKMAFCSMSICSKTRFSLGDRHATCLLV